MSPKRVDCAAASGPNSAKRPAKMHLCTQSTHATQNVAALRPAIRPGKEVQDVKKKPTRLIGIVSIKQCKTPRKGRSYWELRYKDPTTGMDVKRRVNGSSREVQSIAENLTREAYMGRGYLADQSKVPTIEEGFIEALRLTDTLDHVRKERARLSAKFIKWLAEHYPAAKRWDQIRPAMVKAYQINLQNRSLAYDTVRLALAPIKLTWKHMVQNYRDLIQPLPRIKLTQPPKKEIECLDSQEVVFLLEWLKLNAPDLWPMATLQALAGLRMLEATALRAQDVNFEMGTITITETPHHKPKTRDSYRTIPVCDDVFEALKIAVDQQKIIPPGGELFTNRRGNLWVKDGLSPRWRGLRKRAAMDTGLRRLAEIPTRKLRASFATMASRLNIPDRLIKAYIGHSSGDVFGAHYRRIDVDDLRTVSARMNEWRTLIGDESSWKDSGNIPDRSVASH